MTVDVLTSQVEGSLFRRLPALKPRELAACVWSFAQMGYTPDLDWLDAFAAQCMLVAAEFSQQDWSVVVWSLAAIAEAEQVMTFVCLIYYRHAPLTSENSHAIVHV